MCYIDKKNYLEEIKYFLDVNLKRINGNVMGNKCYMDKDIARDNIIA
jgi:hypothetical protein